MKKFTILVVLVALAIGVLQAQQWSDVGDPGFTPSNLTSIFIPYANRMAMYNDIPYMAYVDVNMNVRVMRYTAGAWSTITDPATGTNCNNFHIAFDASGNLYLAYFSGALAAVVKKFDGTSWSIVGGGNVVATGRPLVQSLVINPVNNEPYIAVFFDSSGNQKASVYRFNGTNWVLVGAANFSVATSSVRMAISSTGMPYVTIKEGYNGSTFSVMQFDGTNWVGVGPTGFGNLSNTALTDLAIDGSGVPHVFSANITDDKANVLKYNGSAWVAVGQVDFSAGAADHPFLKFDNSGVLHIAYQDGASANGVNKATVMKFNGTSWVGVGNAGLSGAGVYYPTMAFNSSNLPFIGFRDASTTGSKGTVMKLCTSNAASVTSTSPGTVCGTGAATLGATSSGTLRWYNAATNGAFVGTGPSYTTPSISTTTTYSVAAYDANGCSSSRAVVVATVGTVPTITASTPGSRCSSGSVVLGATPSAGTIDWFAAPTGGSSLGSGTSFTTPSITTTTTYYAEANISGCISNVRTAVPATIKPLPTLGVGIEAFSCGPGTVNLSITASPIGATVTWFAAPSGGSSLATGTIFTTPSLSTSTTYFAESNFNGCTSATRTSLIAEIRPIPMVTSTTPGARCGDGTVDLNSTVSTSATARWYTVPTGGTPVVNTLSYTTPSLTSTTTFHVEAFLNGCASPSRTAVVATVNPIPTVSSSDVTRCDAGTVTFEASSAGTISWFAASTGGSALASGPNYTTPSISVTTPYFAEATLNGCTSTTRTQVQAIVVVSPPLPTITQNNSNIEAPVLISSASSGNQWFKDGSLIAGATATTYTITDLGEYSVQVNSNGCLSPLSDVVLYLITSVEVVDRNLLTLYPNPTTDELVVSLNGFEANKLVNIAFVDLMGRVQNQSSALGGSDVRLRVNHYSPGRYLVLASQGDKKLACSFIKSN